MILDIALPFYGDVDFMKATVHSIIRQTNPNWRLLFVDDGYPDPSLPDWFASLGDSRISYSRNPNNLGANGNFSKCLELISNDYCVIMGADDLMSANYVETIIELIRKFPDAAIIHPGVDVINERGRIYEPKADQIKRLIRPKCNPPKLVFGEELATSLMLGNWMTLPAITWKSKFIKQIGFRANLHVTQDLAMAIDIIKDGGQMALTDDIVFHYRRHSSSDSSVKALTGERFAEEKKLFDALNKEFIEIGWHKAAQVARIHPTSRLHAAMLVPKAIHSGFSPKPLLKHAFL